MRRQSFYNPKDVSEEYYSSLSDFSDTEESSEELEIPAGVHIGVYLSKLHSEELEELFKFCSDCEEAKSFEECTRDEKTAYLATYILDTPLSLLPTHLLARQQKPILAREGFYEALFKDLYPEIHAIFSRYHITENMKKYHNLYRPLSIDTSFGLKETSPNDQKELYHFWQLLYLEMDIVVSSPEVISALESILNDDELNIEKCAFLLDYPFLSLFSALISTPFIEKVVVEHDSPLYPFLEIPVRRIKVHLLSGKPGIDTREGTRRSSL